MNKLNQLLIIAAASVGASFLLLTGVLMPAFAATSPTSTTQISPITTIATQDQAEDNNSGTLDGGVTWQIANDTLTISGGTIGSRIFGVGKYFHSKSTRPFLITKKGI
ncbi:hypothetical protein [Levilactobacillus brevis]|uniref:hypothetical protein n=1 Tax=Levilactobacillus brevis TaxID=1580 RepID=UPI0021A627A3|nr:hypothetical protein [Levilactobacillus brevis]MCT3568862.1 hypothetical protein [Levilactobacillus brevis]MCT3581784.1 hypothetical protein [Levilactobacillus brevis]